MPQPLIPWDSYNAILSKKVSALHSFASDPNPCRIHLQEPHEIVLVFKDQVRHLRVTCRGCPATEIPGCVLSGADVVPGAPEVHGKSPLLFGERGEVQAGDGLGEPSHNHTRAHARRHAECNKMPADNLATVFAPRLVMLSPCHLPISLVLVSRQSQSCRAQFAAAAERVSFR